MFADDLFHPDHVVPAAEFIAALMKFSDFDIAQMFMELFAVSGEIFVFSDRICDAGIQVDKMPCL